MKLIERITNSDLLNVIANLPNQAIASAIIEGNNPGQIFSSDSDKYLLIKTSSCYATLIGELNDSDLSEVIRFLNPYKEIKLICSESYHHIFLRNSYKICPRIEFIYKDKEITLPNNPNITVKLINDQATFAKCNWFEFITTLYGDADNYFKAGFGIAIYYGSELAGEVHSAFIGNGICEIAIITSPDYRGKGIATYGIAYFIKECLDRKLVPAWSCNYENSNSYKTALKSGFTVKGYYCFLEKDENI